MPAQIFCPLLRRGSIRYKKVILYVSQTIFSAFLRSLPLIIPCYFCQCVQAQIQLNAQFGSDQSVLASINFLHTALLQQHYANHFRESLTWSCSQFRTPASAKSFQHSSLLAASWIIYLQLLTWNQRRTTVLPSLSPALVAILLALATVRTTSTSSSVTITLAPCF